MKAKHIMLKIGRMRKEQDFILYPYKEEDKAIMIQSNKSLGILHKETRKFTFTNKGSYSHHLQMYGTETELDDSIKDEIFKLYEESKTYVNSDGTITIFG
jgi:hypothetical protein